MSHIPFGAYSKTKVETCADDLVALRTAYRLFWISDETVSCGALIIACSSHRQGQSCTFYSSTAYISSVSPKSTNSGKLFLTSLLQHLCFINNIEDDNTTLEAKQSRKT